MALSRGIVVAVTLGLAVLGCGSEGKDSAVGNLGAPEPALAIEAAPEPMALPEGFPEGVHLYPEMELTEVVVIDADELRYKVVGASRTSVDDVLEYYEKYFPENAWDEDMIMAQPGNTIISFTKDGLLQYVEAKEGGYGCYVTITTGRL